MSESFSPSGLVGTAWTRFTSGEAATGTFGTMDRDNVTNAANRTRYLDDATGLFNFPATQVTSAGANVLDDYEEGTWTPALNCTSGSITLSTATGFYTKVGRLVTLTARCTVGSVSTPTGQLSIGNNPFTSAVYAGVAVFAAGLNSTATSPLIASIQATATIFVDKMVSGVQTDMAADVKAGTSIFINVSFSV